MNVNEHRATRIWLINIFFCVIEKSFIPIFYLTVDKIQLKYMYMKITKICQNT